jgi:signal transduction histidine kinase
MLSRSLTAKLLIPLIAVGLLLAFTSAWVLETLYHRQSQESIHRRLENLSETLSFILDASPGEAAEANRVLEALATEADIQWLFIAMQGDADIYATSRQAWKGRPLEALEPTLFNAVKQALRSQAPTHTEADLSHTSFYPVQVIDARHPGHFRTALIGIALDTREILRSTLTSQVILLSLFCAGLLLLVGLGTYLIQQHVLLPLTSLISTMEKRQEDTQALAPIHADDEIGQVAQTLNQMLVALDRSSAELQRANAAKDDFFQAMSHELRTPLNAIIGFSDSMSHGIYGEMTPKMSKAVQRIRKGGQHLLSIVEEIMTLSQARHGKLSIQAKPFNLLEALEFGFSLASEKHYDSKVTLKAALPDDPILINGDREKLTQVVINLVTNAMKFTEEGEIKLSVTELPDGSCRWTVSDTGIGMNAEQMQRVFLPFTQADEAISRKYGGCGLGLTIAKEIVELHGGKIRVHSSLGEGTEFSVTLPADLVHPAS